MLRNPGTKYTRLELNIKRKSDTQTGNKIWLEILILRKSVKSNKSIKVTSKQINSYYIPKILNSWWLPGNSTCSSRTDQNIKYSNFKLTMVGVIQEAQYGRPRNPRQGKVRLTTLCKRWFSYQVMRTDLK